MMNGDAAGHKFEDGRCRCGILWVDIRNTTAEDVGKPNIAHHGNLNQAEITQIQTLRDKEDMAISAAFGWR